MVRGDTPQSDRELRMPKECFTVPNDTIQTKDIHWNTIKKRAPTIVRMYDGQEFKLMRGVVALRRVE